MRDGVSIGIGKGNKNWNYSVPHGAGRVLSRVAVKELITLNKFKESVRGVFTTSVNINTIDEYHMVYKPMKEILEIIKPIYNFKVEI